MVRTTATLKGCISEKAPKKPDIEWLLDEKICISNCDAEKLTLWILRLDRWIQEVQENCMEGTE